MNQAMISLADVTKSYPGAARPAVKSLFLDVYEGETTVLVGPSGCGKTTSMKMINRLIEPSSGTITVDGENVLAQDPNVLRRSIGYVIQQIGLLPHRTVAQNIATVPKLLGWDRPRTRARIDELVALVELDPEMLPRYPLELSGGQRQRVGVARALAADPPVLLMDEPFGAVDPIVRGRLQDSFLDLQRSLRKTIVFVTHDIDEAIKMADRIAILNVGGILEQYAPPAELLRAPANPFVEQFLGEERGLKRLALIPVSTVATKRGPVVARTAKASEAKEVMRREGTTWVAVVEGDRVLGWLDESELGTDGLQGAAPQRFKAHVRPNDSLRHALDVIVTSRTNVAIVLGEGDRYEGMVDVAHISGQIGGEESAEP